MKNTGLAQHLLWLVVIVGIITPDATPRAQEHSVNPGINRHYHAPNFDEWVRRFETPGREVYDKRYAIVSAIGLRPGMIVADIGAGTGLFTRLFSPEVGPRGRVIAIDISQDFIDNILRGARTRSLRNVEGMVNTPRAIPLPEASIDLAFICDTYHHFEYPHSTMRSLHHALRPGGTVVVIDFHKIAGYSSPWIMRHVRSDKETTVREIEQAGFELIEELPVLRTNYFLRFRKR